MRKQRVKEIIQKTTEKIKNGALSADNVQPTRE